MSQITSKEKIPFTQIANYVLNDNTLSTKAKGMFAYLFSKPEGWDFSSVRISKELKEGRNAVLSMLKELEEHCYLIRIKQLNGRMNYELAYTKKPVLQS